MNTENDSFVVLNTYQTFGEKAYWLGLSKWLETPFIFFIIAFGISLVRRTSLVPPQFQRAVALAALVFFGISIVSFIISFFIARFAYRSQVFCFSADAFKMRTGVFTKRETAIPYRQIQNVEIERTFSQQMMGVSKVVVVTAGQDDSSTPQNESKVVLNSVDKKLAEDIQDVLLQKADIQKVVANKK